MNKSGIVKSSGFKIALLLVLVLLFLIPLSMVEGIISERGNRAKGVENDIMSSWGGEFTALGPILIIPGITHNQDEDKTITNFSLFVAPTELDLNINLDTELRRRGIFSVPLFAGSINYKGSFDINRAINSLAKNQQVFLDRAEIFITLADQKGIRTADLATWDGENIYFQPGGRTPVHISRQNQDGGIYSQVAVDLKSDNKFNINLLIQGGRLLNIAPLGEETRVFVASDWPSPSFQGNYLPIDRKITDDGFQANWTISHLSRNIPNFWTSNNTPSVSSSMFGVTFIKPLDNYGLNTRVAKYGLLVIIMPFLSLFIAEMLLRRPIHFVQYLLMGIANVIFYLLLLSISEHLAFGLAYVISAIAVSVMVTLYAISLFGTWKKALFMALIMSLCYIFLYITLQSEWALLIGSVGAFAITGVIMFLTRKFDWSGGITS
jgi:inner membrane protein